MERLSIPLMCAPKRYRNIHIINGTNRLRPILLELEKLGDVVGPSVGIGVRSGVGNGVWAGDGIGARLDVKSDGGVRADNQTAVVWGGVGGLSTTGLGHCNPPAMAKRKLLVS